MEVPHIPNGWAELSWEQLTHVWDLLEQKKDQLTRCLAVYCYLSGAKVQYVDKALTPDNSDTALAITYKEETSLVHADEFYIYLLGIPVEEKDLRKAKEIQIPSKGVMSWLEDPYTLYQLPLEYYRIGGNKYKMPEPLFTSLSYQQYCNMQKILQAYWQITRRIANSPNDQTTNLLNDQKEAARLRAQFMSHALCSRSFRIVRKDTNATALSPKFVYTYTVEAAEDNIKHFYKAPNSLFMILQQYFSSCLEYYRREMPELFSSANKISVRSPLMAEIDTLNAIMKWKGAYPTHQDVYDTNAIFIFGDLKDMAKEAREIEAANAKAKR